MRVRVHTMSGSVYSLDSVEMTWARLNNNLGHEEILGYDANEGKLSVWPSINVGFPMYFFFENPSEKESVGLRTTQVVRVELI